MLNVFGEKSLLILQIGDDFIGITFHKGTKFTKCNHLIPFFTKCSSDAPYYPSGIAFTFTRYPLHIFRINNYPGVFHGSPLQYTIYTLTILYPYFISDEKCHIALNIQHVKTGQNLPIRFDTEPARLISPQS
jgi:hypothetical protein